MQISQDKKPIELNIPRISELHENKKIEIISIIHLPKIQFKPILLSIAEPTFIIRKPKNIDAIKEKNEKSPTSYSNFGIQKLLASSSCSSATVELTPKPSTSNPDKYSNQSLLNDIILLTPVRI